MTSTETTARRRKVKRLLIDTSALYALNDADDRSHSAAMAFWKANPDALFVMSSPIFGEFLTLAKKRFGGRAVVKAGEFIRQSPRFEVVHLDENDEEAVWEIFHRYADKDWSWFDVTLFHLARKLGVWEVFAFDDHFRQMGLSVLPGP
ncbi:MAG: hypothetical protein DRN81_06990 [Thermoproteota archaeon]|nr:MAG: hypothetical protein DRN81_06990 [Candidatus Korarchaeota archaeon]